MTPARLAASLLLLGWIFIACAFLSGCSGFGSPQFCVKTDYGTFSYSLPEMPARTLFDK